MAPKSSNSVEKYKNNPIAIIWGAKWIILEEQPPQWAFKSRTTSLIGHLLTIWSGCLQACPHDFLRTLYALPNGCQKRHCSPEDIHSIQIYDVRINVNQYRMSLVRPSIINSRLVGYSKNIRSGQHKSNEHTMSIIAKMSQCHHT